MSSAIQSIIPGYGIDKIKFGMTRDEVKAILGEPDWKEKYSYTDDEDEMTISWEYYDLALSLNFDEEEDWRLIDIAVSSESAQLNGVQIIGKDKAHLTNILNDMGVSIIYEEDQSSTEGPNHSLIEIEQLSMNFWLNNGLVDEIQLSPFFIDDDTIKWPE